MKGRRGTSAVGSERRTVFRMSSVHETSTYPIALSRPAVFDLAVARLVEARSSERAQLAVEAAGRTRARALTVSQIRH